VSGFNIQTAGTVLFVIGLISLPLALLWTFWWPNRTDETQLPTRQQPPVR
jgi:hypothetical protein